MIYTIDFDRLFSFVSNCKEARELVPTENVELYIEENLEQLRNNNNSLRMTNKRLNRDLQVFRAGFTVSCMLLGALAFKKAIDNFKR